MHRPPSFSIWTLRAAILGAGVLLGSSLARAEPGSRRADGLEVKKVEIAGLPAELANFPRAGLALSPRPKLLGTRRTLLTQRTLDADRERIRVHLVRHGYPDVVVTAAAAADEKGKKATVVFTVVPGERVRYGEVTLTGMPPSMQESAEARLAEAVSSGAPFDQDSVEALRAVLLDTLREESHARPDIQVRVTRETRTADVRFDVTPGPRYVFGDVAVVGLEPDLTWLATRVIGIRPGEPAAASRLRDVSRDLRRLNLFRQVDVATAPVEPDTLDLSVKLSLQNMTSWELSIGTFTDEWLRGSVAWTHRNLFGRGRSLRVQGEVSEHEIEGLIRASWPALVLRRSRSDLSLSYDIADEENYLQRTAEAEAAITLEPWETTTTRFGVALSVDEVDEDPSSHEFFSDDAGLTPLLRVRIYRDGSDNPIEPIRGHRETLAFEWSPPIDLSENPYLWVHGYGSAYRSILEKTVFAVRLDLGFAEPLGDATDLLPSHRYFAGGATSMRAYERRRLGQVDSANEPIGGEVMALAGGELRHQAGKVAGVRIGFTMFLDSGQVWDRREDARIGDFQAALGAGLLIGTPVGPLRFEAAQNIGVPMHGDPDRVYHFAIGHPY